MPLLDHFHPPLKDVRHWEAFHARWAAALADALNLGGLPAGYFAEMQVHVGSRVEVDLGTFEEHANGPAGGPPASGAGAATAVASPIWAPPAPALVMPAVFPDELEVLVYESEGGPTLVAAVELVSPGNKDREETRQAFAAKCASHLQQGIGLVVVDVVTSRQFNLHDQLVRLMGQPETFLLPGAPALYAVSYRPRRRKSADQIEIWPAPLAVGQPLPVLPLPLRGNGCVRLDLEASYTEARQRSRLP
jgi:hypothetical protein